MDDLGRKKIQTLICKQIASRSFDDANNDSVKIMDAVEADARTYFANVGITLDFIGWADTFTFDPVIQKAVNDAYVAQHLATSVTVLTALGNIQIQEGMGKGMADKGLPVVVTPGMVDAILGVVQPQNKVGAPYVDGVVKK